MALIQFKEKGLRAISSVVPKRTIFTRELTDSWEEEHLAKFIEATGIEERRIADDGILTSDLCLKAAEKIFESTSISKDDIDMVIFITQTPDYKVPGNSISIQERLGLSPNVICYDLSLACSGFIQGILMAYSFLNSPEINNVLVMVGDTLSKITSPKDHGTGLLLGDAGTATVVGKGAKYGESFFSIRTDGKNIQSVYLPAGGTKTPSSTQTMKIKEYPDGSRRSLEHLVMVGDDVFSFAIHELPKDIKRLLEYSHTDISQIDFFAFHQSNNFMMNYIAKKAKADKTKILHSIEKFGNTAGTSIPLCLTYNRNQILTQNKEDVIVLMNAIGAGFAYGTVQLNLVDCDILPIHEI